jgi:hypothetical protein
VEISTQESIQLSSVRKRANTFFILTTKPLPEMSATAESDGDQSMNLEQLNGAVLTYETADGGTVTVEFDE